MNAAIRIAVLTVAVIASGCMCASERKPDGTVRQWCDLGGGNRYYSIATNGTVTASHTEMPAYLDATGRLIGTAGGTAGKIMTRP